MTYSFEEIVLAHNLKEENINKYEKLLSIKVGKVKQSNNILYKLKLNSDKIH